MKIRITGTETEVAEAARRLGDLFRVLETSHPYARRNSALVSVYLEVEAGPTAAAEELRAVRARITTAFTESADRWTADRQLTLEEVAERLDSLIERMTP